MKSRQLFSIAALLIVAFGSTANALDCDNAQNQQEMNRCVAQHYQGLDLQLNAVWAGLKACLSGEQAQWDRLVRVQKGWIRLKERQCTYEADNDWGGFEEDSLRGSGWPLGYYGCMSQMTEERTVWLSEQFQRNCQ
ncbi:MAG: lysozyme inhibitor LprI family protein [Pseudomonadota bacterium]